MLRQKLHASDLVPCKTPPIYRGESLLACSFDKKQLLNEAYKDGGNLSLPI